MVVILSLLLLVPGLLGAELGSSCGLRDNLSLGESMRGLSLDTDEQLLLFVLTLAHLLGPLG